MLFLVPGASKFGVYLCRNADVQLRLADGKGLSNCTLVVFKVRQAAEMSLLNVFVRTKRTIGYLVISWLVDYHIKKTAIYLVPCHIHNKLELLVHNKLELIIICMLSEMLVKLLACNRKSPWGKDPNVKTSPFFPALRGHTENNCPAL